MVRTCATSRSNYIDLTGDTRSSIGYGILGMINGGALQLLEPWAYAPDGFSDSLYDGTENVQIAEATIIENAIGGAAPTT